MTISSNCSSIEPGPNACLQLPWIEKYRPVSLKETVGNEQIIERLKVISHSGNMPHLILSGSPGIGKTTCIVALAHELLGPHYADAVLELNASDERGIDVVRQNIKMFSQKKVTLPPSRHKIVILDEADSMTIGAQQALRRTMEIFSDTTRFAFACNHSNKIIEPIQSRCVILRFSALTQEQLCQRILEICQSEGVQYTSEGLEALLYTSQGDMRKAINNLQSIVSGLGFVNLENVYKMVDEPNPSLMNQILMHCSKGELGASLDILKTLWSKGYAPLDLISSLFRVAKLATFLPPKLQLDAIKEIGTTHMRALEGFCSLLQLSALLARMAKLSLPSTETWKVPNL